MVMMNGGIIILQWNIYIIMDWTMKLILVAMKKYTMSLRDKLLLFHPDFGVLLPVRIAPKYIIIRIPRMRMVKFCLLQNWFVEWIIRW
mgnify:CR=1 FL=1